MVTSFLFVFVYSFSQPRKWALAVYGNDALRFYLRIEASVAEIKDVVTTQCVFLLSQSNRAKTNGTEPASLQQTSV